MDIGKRIIVHRLLEIDGVENLDVVVMLQQGVSALNDDTALRTSKLGQFTEVSEFVRVTVLFRALHHLLLIVLSYL